MYLWSTLMGNKISFWAYPHNSCISIGKLKTCYVPISDVHFWYKSTNYWYNRWIIFQSKPLGAVYSPKRSLQSAVRAVLLWLEICCLWSYYPDFFCEIQYLLINKSQSCHTEAWSWYYYTLHQSDSVLKKIQLPVTSDNRHICTPAKIPNFITWHLCINTIF